jgi:hypothetical protein
MEREDGLVCSHVLLEPNKGGIFFLNGEAGWFSILIWVPLIVVSDSTYTAV